MGIKKAKGWIRIGITLSVAWVVTFSTYSLIAYYGTTSPFVEYPSWLIEFVEDTSAQPLKHADPRVGAYPVKQSLRTTPFLVGAFAPVLLSWVLVCVVVITTRWIARGFKEEN